MASKTVVGLFDELSTAERVVHDLQQNGFARDDISLMARDTSRGGQTTIDKGTTHEGSKAGEGAATGAGTGAVLGGLAGLLVGLGALAIPGVGPIIAAGPIAAALAGAGIGAAAGGLVGAMVGAGIPEEEANVYAEGVRRGGTLVMVRAADESLAGVAQKVIKNYDPIDIHTRSEQWKHNKWSRFDEKAQPYTDEQIAREREMYRTRGTGSGTTSGTMGSTTGTRTPSGSSTGTRTTSGGTTGTRTTSGGTTGGGTTGGGTTGGAREYGGTRREFADYNQQFQTNYQSRYANAGRDYSYYEPAYRYGFDLAGKEQYQGRDWNEIEPQVRRDWERNHPNTAWEDFKDAIHHAFQHGTGQSRDQGNYGTTDYDTTTRR